MIKALEKLDPKAAVGLLARAALSFSYVDDTTPLPDEQTLRSQIISEARDMLGIDRFDESGIAKEKIVEFLDEQSDLIVNIDTEAALKRMSETGDLPSDLYNIVIIPNVVDIYKKSFGLEQKVIEETVRNPSIEQHYGPAQGLNQPAMISLFARTFRTRFIYKDFINIVAGGSRWPDITRSSILAYLRQ